MTTEISDLDNSENKKDLIKRLSEAKSSVILPSSGNKLVTRNSELTKKSVGLAYKTQVTPTKESSSKLGLGS